MYKKVVRYIGIVGVSAAMMCLVSSLSFAEADHSSEGKIEKISLNLNTASQSEIARVINAIIEIDLCHEITGYRIAHKGFRNIEELKNVNGVDEKIFKKIVDRIALEI